MDDKKKESKSVESGDNVVKGVYQTYRAEFKKIVWPSRETLLKHTVTVIAVSLTFGAYIAFNDFVFSQVFRQFVNWIA
jgi:preprotein translocase subunit SecE